MTGGKLDTTKKQKADKKGIERLFDKGEYRVKLEQTLSELLSKTSASQTEDSISSLFETSLYYFIKNYFGIDIEFKKEVGQKMLRHSFSGRIDAICNDLIIEYKKPTTLKNESDKNAAIKQIMKYISQIKQETGKELQGILTDGQKICFFYFQNSVLKNSPFNGIDVKDFDKIVRALINTQNKKFVPMNIVSDFSVNSPLNITKELSQSLFKAIINSPSEMTLMLFKEWENIFHLSENDKGQNIDIKKRRGDLKKLFGQQISNNDLDYKSLFVLQTAYAIIIKLIACKVISKLLFNDDIVYFSDLSLVGSNELREFIESLEDGYVFSAGGIKNLLEGDFFSWYSLQEQWNEDFFVSIKKVIKAIDQYSNFSFNNLYFAIDIFKDLYMKIMPNSVRHSLGEYFTPSWMANYVVKKSIKSINITNWRAIDPCCGSGIFIISLINEIIGNIDVSNMSETDKANIIKEITERVMGIDINPIAVLTARVSYLLTISPFIENCKFEIPVFLGDSANIPIREQVGGIPCYKYSINTEKGQISVVLPCGFVNDATFVEKMSRLQTNVKAKKADLLYEQIIDLINPTEINDEIKKLILAFAEKIVYLHKNKWDGIWVRIATNFMLVARVKEIDLIIGNPPWVKWEYLPQYYAEKIKSICIDRRIFSGQRYMGAISLNICALIANVTASTWLKKEGTLSFLMPKTLMTQDSYEGFRNFYTNYEDIRLYIQEVDDWSNSGNPFIITQEKFMTYYFRYKLTDYSIGIPLNKIVKKKGVSVEHLNKFNSFSDIEENFIFKKGKACQLDKKRTGFTIIDSSYINKNLKSIVGKSYYKARSGVEFTPAEIYFVEPVKKSTAKTTYMFKNSIFTNSIYKSKEKGIFELETEMVKPVIKSPYINEFGIEQSDNYCIFPYKERNSIPLKKLNKQAPNTTTYLIKCREIIGKQSKRSKMIMQGNDFYSLSKVGDYTFAKYMVAFRDNTKIVSSVIEPQLTPWRKLVMPICAKHSPYISMDINGNFITKEEAFYLAGILNTPIVQEYFKCTFSERSYSIKFNIKMPKYDRLNIAHKTIFKLSEKAHKYYTNKKLIDKIKLKIQENYLIICKEE